MTELIRPVRNGLMYVLIFTVCYFVSWAFAGMEFDGSWS
jgi:hypothetical protein